MSTEKAILEYLMKNKQSIKYKGVKTTFLGLPDFKYYKYQTFANRCSDLKRKGFIKEVNGNYFITSRGEDFLNKKDYYFKKFETDKKENDPKDLLILYDIPQNKTTSRNWFRGELQRFCFVMIQRSVWVGPSPLPKEFSEHLKNIGLDKCIKTFKLAKGYKI